MQGPAVGCHWLSLGAPVIAELAAEAEPDAIVVDMQHGLWTRASLEVAIGLVAGRAPVLARTADASDFAIGSCLDAGAHGVIVPMVNSAAECASVVAAAHYPPHGRRSGGGVRVGSNFAAYRAACQHIVVAAMIETVEAVEDCEAIAATPGLDLVFIGPNDLSLSMGEAQGSPAFEAVLKRILAAGKAAGTPVGIYTGGVDQGLARAAEGYRFVVAASDAGIVRGESRAMLSRFKADVGAAS
ncbi:MAG TPA: aldolase/citrate lyase family protein [Caulobacteraceae bacterium]|nr:aldolase/citrate lyase family protein [Caulobacteraceae bacterium]